MNQEKFYQLPESTVLAMLNFLNTFQAVQINQLINNTAKEVKHENTKLPNTLNKK